MLVILRKPKTTPATCILYADKEGKPCEQTWHYRSVIGKLMFLSGNTRPDIAFAVHQCARFSTNPRASHERAVKQIGRYLLGTRDKGLIIRPEYTGELNAHCDSDFAGMWHKKHTHLRENVLSRTGYVIHYCNVPIFWKSSLQTEIALSSTEAEYMALSHCMRDVLHLRRIVTEMTQKSFIRDCALNGSKIFNRALRSSKIYEDNASCIIVANSDNVRPRTRHISTKYH